MVTASVAGLVPEATRSLPHFSPPALTRCRRLPPAATRPRRLAVMQKGPGEVAHAAAPAALGSLGASGGMLSRGGAAPPPVLKSGGLGIRELRKTATSVKVDVRAAVLYTEVARAAGLLA